MGDHDVREKQSFEHLPKNARLYRGSRSFFHNRFETRGQLIELEALRSKSLREDHGTIREPGFYSFIHCQ